MKVEVNPMGCEPDCTWKEHEGKHPVVNICSHITLTNAQRVDEAGDKFDVFDGFWIHCAACNIEYYIELARYYD